MNKSVRNALKSVAVLVCIAVVCVAILAVCNMYFPKYVPTLDRATAGRINAICPTGVTDGEAFDGKYIVMLNDDDYGVDLNSYNKSHKSKKAEILAVYGEPKGENAFSYIIESSSAGRDGDIVILVAYRDAVIVGAAVKKQGESYFSKLPDDLFTSLEGKSGNVDLGAQFGKTGATLSLNAINRAVNLSNDFAISYNSDIRGAMADTATASETDNTDEAVA